MNMEAKQQDKDMYRRSTHRAIMVEIRQLVQAALRGDDCNWGARQEHISRVVKLGLQQSYQEALRRGCEMAMGAGRAALRDFIRKHEPEDGGHMCDIGFLFAMEPAKEGEE